MIGVSSGKCETDQSCSQNGTSSHFLSGEGVLHQRHPISWIMVALFLTYFENCFALCHLHLQNNSEVDKIRQQLVRQQKELLDLQQKKLMLELEQTKQKLANKKREAQESVAKRQVSSLRFVW